MTNAHLIWRPGLRRSVSKNAGLAPDQVAGIILATSSPDRMQPATATRVQHLLGAKSAFAFDINSVCSGGTFGIALADSLIRSGQYENILLVAAEVYSRILNPKDYATFPFFGDGAGGGAVPGGSRYGKGGASFKTPKRWQRQ